MNSPAHIALGSWRCPSGNSVDVPACASWTFDQRWQARSKALEKALAQVEHLQGLLPSCAWCKKVRDGANYWQQVEAYVSEHSQATFTHTICPDCREKTFPRAG